MPRIAPLVQRGTTPAKRYLGLFYRRKTLCEITPWWFDGRMLNDDLAQQRVGAQKDPTGPRGQEAAILGVVLLAGALEVGVCYPKKSIFNIIRIFLSPENTYCCV